MIQRFSRGAILLPNSLLITGVDGKRDLNCPITNTNMPMNIQNSLERYVLHSPFQQCVSGFEPEE